MNKSFNILSFILLSTFLLSCKHEAVYKNVVYLSSAETSVTTTLTVEDTGGELALTAKSAQIVNSPVNVSLNIDNTLIEEYNTKNGKNYSALPEDSYELSGNSVTISAGSNISDAIKLSIKSTDDFKDGVSYMIPVTIKNSDKLPVLNSSRTIFIIINRIIISNVASLTNNYFNVDFSKNSDNLKSLSNVTYEIRVRVNSFQSRSPFISSIMGIEENFLLRFGDVTVKPNQLQMAGGSTATNVPMEFATGIWYHLAGVYDGSSLKIYVNGELAAKTDASRTIDLTDQRSGGFHFGFSAGGRLLNGEISEARIWSKVLSPAEIVNGMCGIDPTSPELIGYWKFNEGEGNTAYDISGNGHDAIANRDVVWIPNVRCN